MSEEIAKSKLWVDSSKVVAIIVVLACGILGMKYLQKNGPKADLEAPKRVAPVVRVVTVKSAPEPLYVETQGRVEPHRRTQAASEVMGRVVKVAPQFKVGGTFAKNEMMLKTDSADYSSMLATAKSALADAQLALTQEEARADQARRDWAKLGRGVAPDLVVRKPQIISAKARIDAAKASVGKAIRDLDRTELLAPYACRVEATYTDFGSYIATGARLADLYSSDAFEVRVPVTLEEIGYLKQDDIIGTEVIMKATIGNKERKWNGKIVRNEGLVDRNTMTVHLAVAIEKNEDASLYGLPPSGLFVRASITGIMMENVSKIPRSALREDNTVITITPENTLAIIPVKVARTLKKTVLISEGLKDGARVIVSPIETPVDGMKLRVEEGKRVSE